jgi:Plavaka transposase
LGNLIEYIQISPSFKDSIVERNGGKVPSAGTGIHAHCGRELFHAQWAILLDDELIGAMKHGIVILCPDGMLRRFYIRIFTYTGDYPEK